MKVGIVAILWKVFKQNFRELDNSRARILTQGLITVNWSLERKTTHLTWKCIVPHCIFTFSWWRQRASCFKGCSEKEKTELKSSSPSAIYTPLVPCKIRIYVICWRHHGKRKSTTFRNFYNIKKNLFPYSTVAPRDDRYLLHSWVKKDRHLGSNTDQ